MVSRETTRPLRKLVPAVAIGVSALLGVVGCSAGQVAQTAEMEPAVNGNSGQVGSLLLRDVVVAYPENGEPYRAGEDAPLTLTIVNVGGDDDELTEVTTEAGEVEIVGNARIPGRTSLAVVLPADNPSASSAEATTTTTTTTTTEESTSETSEAPTSETGTSGSQPPSSGTSTPPVTTTEEETPDVVGTISLVITGLTGDLPFGKRVDVTFKFANAGEVTVSLPVAAPATARAENRDEDMAGSGAEGH
jgi:copper(I)-binding protein